ncbi:hypothetical protein TgHK011_001995 [Trichoderma gracile]|nr:hypothetical protein TgHK011_001995 [Trichoderma gracile]
MCQSKPTDIPSTLFLDGIATATKYYHESLCPRGMDLTEYKKRGFDPRPYMIGAFAGNKVQVNDGPPAPPPAPPIPLHTFGAAVYGGATANEGTAPPVEGQQQDGDNEERQSVMDMASLFRGSADGRAEAAFEGEGSGRHSADAASVNQNPLGNPTANSTGSGYAANPDMVADMA